MKRILGLSIILLILVGCGKPSGATSGKKGMGKKSDTILTSPVMVEKVKKTNLKEYITVSGTLSGIVDVTMMSETTGTILEIYKELGQYVEKNEQIAKLDNDHIRIQYEQAKATTFAAEASLATANANYTTSEELYKKGSISKVELDNSLAAYKSGQANYAGAQANEEMKKLSYDKSRLVAPVSGYIASTNLEIGNALSMGSMIVTIVDYTQLKLKTGVNESELFLVKNGQKVEIKSNLSKATLNGKISGIGMKPLANSSTYPIEIIANNKAAKYAPGMVVSGKILARTYKNQIFTSLNHILDDYGKKFVYVVDSDKKAHKRYVELGSLINENVIIKSGLKVDDLLVIEGMDMLNEDALVEIKG